MFSRGKLCESPVHRPQAVLVTPGIGALPCSVSACTQSYHTAYFFCIPHRLEALSPFRAELPSERGTRLRREVSDPACAPCRVSCVSCSYDPSPSKNGGCAYNVCH